MISRSGRQLPKMFGTCDISAIPESNSSPSLRSLRVTDFSRQSLQLLMQIQRRVSVHGVMISLTAPDALAQVLNASLGVEEQDLEALRASLLEMLPHIQRIYHSAYSPQPPTCRRCGRMVHVEPTVPKTDTFLYRSCTCGVLFEIFSEDRRQSIRKSVELPGVYFYGQDWRHIGELVVENLSLGGVRLQNLSDHVITPDEVLRLSFALDDQAHTVINETVRILQACDTTLRASFVNTSMPNHALAVYLGVSWLKADQSMGKGLQRAAHEVSRG